MLIVAIHNVRNKSETDEKQRKRQATKRVREKNLAKIKIVSFERKHKNVFRGKEPEMETTKKP